MNGARGELGLSSAYFEAIWRKYSNALTSSSWTPSPREYIRPSFQAASGWPCSAANRSESSARSFSPA